MKKLFDKVGKKKEKEGSLVGKVVMVGQYSVKVEAIVGEGGFATIYRCVDMKSGVTFALKHMRLAADTDAIKEVQQEAKTMARLKGHPNILKLHAVAFAGPPGAETDGFMLLDFCPLTLLEVLQRANFSLDDFLVYEVFQDVARAVAHMHKCTPPLAHRDLKAENVLKNGEGRWVICDFGSSTSRAQVYDTPAEIAAEEDNIRRTTTPAYRAPEMWDLYARQRIDTAVDVWALGVLLYVLAFGKLPFQGDSKLSILYGKYDMPPGRPAAMRSLIQDMLQVNPVDRPDIFQVLSRLDALRAVLAAEAGGSGEAPPLPTAAPPGTPPPGPAPAPAGYPHPHPQQLHQQHSGHGAPPQPFYSNAFSQPQPQPPQPHMQAPPPYPGPPSAGQPPWPAGPPGPPQPPPPQPPRPYSGPPQAIARPPGPPPLAHQHPQPHVHMVARPAAPVAAYGYPPSQRPPSQHQLQPYPHPHAHPQHQHQHPPPHPSHFAQHPGHASAGPEGSHAAPHPHSHPYAQPGQGPGPAPGVPPGGAPRPSGPLPMQRAASFQPDWAAAPLPQPPQPPPDLLDAPVFVDGASASAFTATAAQAAAVAAPGRELSSLGSGSAGNGAALGQAHAPNASSHRRTGSGQHPRSAPAGSHPHGGFGFGGDDADWGEQPAFLAAASAASEVPPADRRSAPHQAQPPPQHAELLSMDSLPAATGPSRYHSAVLSTPYAASAPDAPARNADSAAGSPRVAIHAASPWGPSVSAAAPAAAPARADVPVPAATAQAAAPAAAAALAGSSGTELNGVDGAAGCTNVLPSASNGAAPVEQDGTEVERLRAQVRQLCGANSALEGRVMRLEGQVAAQAELLHRLSADLRALQQQQQQQQERRQQVAPPQQEAESLPELGHAVAAANGVSNGVSASQRALAPVAQAVAAAPAAVDGSERSLLPGDGSVGGVSTTGGVLTSFDSQPWVALPDEQPPSGAAIYPTIRYADLS